MRNVVQNGFVCIKLLLATSFPLQCYIGMSTWVLTSKLNGGGGISCSPHQHLHAVIIDSSKTKSSRWFSASVTSFIISNPAEHGTWSSYRSQTSFLTLLPGIVTDSTWRTTCPSSVMSRFGIWELKIGELSSGVGSAFRCQWCGAPKLP